jgi:hypothetical protein
LGPVSSEPFVVLTTPRPTIIVPSRAPVQVTPAPTPSHTYPSPSHLCLLDLGLLPIPCRQVLSLKPLHGGSS